MPKVSVIIPNYNHAPFLQERIQSVLNQTFQDFEIIYLDDASTDNSAEVIAPFIQRYGIQTILNSQNSGSPFKQWNRGVEVAQGEYIWLAESDDFADKRLLERLVDQLDRHQNVGLAYCQSYLVDEHSKKHGSYKDHMAATSAFDCSRWGVDFVGSGKEECINFLSHTNTIPNASAVLFRRSLYEQLGDADPTKSLCGDWLMWVKILLNSDLAFVSEPLNYYRVHGGTARARANPLKVAMQEDYHIFQYLTEQVSIPPTAHEQACQILFDRWMNSWSFGIETIEPRQLQQFIETISRIDPRIGPRLVGRLRSTHIELARSQAGLLAMASSKFWKLRQRWFKLKSRFGFVEP
jgi:glycosyltransferase involved in cell wall biosynthesis